MAIILFSVSSGCDNGATMRANVDLRKQNQQLTEQVGQLKTDNAGLTAQVAALQSKWPTTQVLPESRLDQLFTTHGISIGKETGFIDDGKTLAVYAVPTDEQGQPLKTAGSFSIELFDLALSGDTHIGKWDFSIEQARQAWLGQLIFYTYLLNCPVQTTPAHKDLLVRVTFVDALTGRQFTADKEISWDSPTTSPSTSPVAGP